MCYIQILLYYSY